MDKNEKTSRDYYVVDLAHVVKVVWKNIWAVAVSGVVVAVLGFAVIFGPHHRNHNQDKKDEEQNHE